MMFDYYIINLIESTPEALHAADAHGATLDSVRKDDAGKLAVIETIQGQSPDRPGLVIVSGPMTVEEAREAVAGWNSEGID